MSAKSKSDSLLQAAQSLRIDFSDILSVKLLELVNAHADAIGVPPEFIVWPLLTATASFMDTNASIQVNKEWLEPAIIWFVIAAKKGEKKTAALRRIRKPIEKIQETMRYEWEKASTEEKLPTPPQLIIDHFSFEELHTVMLRNECKLLGMFDELSCFYGQLDLYKHCSTVDRKTLLTLNGGGSWGRNFKSYSGHMESTAFNVTGFIQPSYVYDMLTNSPDADGLNDRQLFDFPPDREVFLDDLKVPMPPDTADLKELFIEIMEQHKKKRVYTLENEAYEAYKGIHDELVKMKLKTHNENAQGILSKARGYAARIAMIVHALEQALDRITTDSTPSDYWMTTVTKMAVKAAGVIISHFNNQKFIMLGLNGDGILESDLLSIPKRISKILSMETKSGDGIIMPSEVSQKHISEKIGCSYPTAKAVELILQAADLGYGEVEEYYTPNKRSIKRFRKRPLNDLSTECREALKKSCITDDIYSRAFLPHVDTNSTLEEH